MNTSVVVENSGRRRRRRHTAEFKASVVQACQQPGVSIATVALSNGLNGNLLRRWVAEAEQQAGGGVPSADPPAAAQRDGGGSTAAFVPLALPTSPTS